MLFGYANENDIIEIEKCGRECLPLYNSSKDLTHMLHDENHKLLTIVDEDKLIGFAITKTGENNLAYIMSIGIYPQYQNKQLGSKMLDLVKEILPNKNIILYAQTSNKRAVSFYKKNEFIIMNKIDDYYTNISNKNAYKMIYLR